mmetsp:Transcript_13598/g.46058  ORF Transcript_13598/g.46058 Transcript_13598/m.46058 type:complete len:215 (+) Transcript_13598:1555-2199(+)
MCSDSMVWGSRPCMMSITRMAMSQSDDPRDRRLEKDSWPGVSMMRRPGTVMSSGEWRCMPSVCLRRVSTGKKEAPICWVMPPASPACTLVRRILSRSLVLPVSTWPMMQQMGDRRSSRDRALRARSMRSLRARRAASRRARRSASALSSSSSPSDESSSSSEEESESPSEEPDSESSPLSTGSALPSPAGGASMDRVLDVGRPWSLSRSASARR